MPKRLPREVWDEIRAKYEDIDSGYNPARLAKEYGVCNSSITYRIKKESWISPKKVKRDAKKLIEERERNLREGMMEDLAKEYEKVRQINFDLAKKALEDFARTNPVPKDFHEAVRASSMAREAAGIQEDTGIKIGINLAALSCGGIEDVVDV